MNRTLTKRGRTLALAAAGLALLMVAAPAWAHEPPGRAHGHKHHKKHAKHGHRHGWDHVHGFGHGHYEKRHRRGHYDHGPRHVVVPRLISSHHAVRRYRPYRHRTVWHAPHRHAHAVYVFPVRSEFGVVHRPYHYCDGELFLDSYIGYRGDRFSFHVRF